MRKAFARLVQRVLAPLRPADTFQADFDDVAEMVIVARALRRHGYRIHLGARPYRLVVSVSKPRSGGSR